MGLVGRESVVERWMFVRRVERKAFGHGGQLNGNWGIRVSGVNHRGGLRHVLGLGYSLRGNSLAEQR